MQGLLLEITPERLLTATLMFFGFFGAQFIASIIVPGFKREGFPTPAGERRTYKLNGLFLFLGTQAVIAIGTAAFGWSLTPILTHFWSLLVVANVFSFVALFLLYLKGRREEGANIERDSKLPPLLHDLWFGNQLNPTLFGVDLKMFFYQPSLIGLFVVVLAFAYRQYELYGMLTPQMILFVGFWWVYLFTHYVRESFMLSTWDIIAEKFGFMLVWGDTVYVPFFYSICGWFVIDYVTPWPPWMVALIVVVHAAGHYVFRSSNWQKDRYKRDPNAKIWGRAAETLDGRLLVSGWWGIGRKLNYTGEIVVYTTFAICAGTSSPIPYILPFSLLILLSQRAARDDNRCRQKYGELWERYCERARFKMFPFVY